MTLHLPSVPQIFKHSGEFSAGTGQIRKGMASIVVALDGSGDFDNIQEGIDALPSAGGSVFIKEGTYNIYKTIMIEKSGVRLEGTGYGTHLKLCKPFTNSVMGNVFIGISSVNYIKIENLRIDLNDDESGRTGIDIDTSTRLVIRSCWFQNNNGGSAFIWANGFYKSIITNNILTNSADGIYSIYLEHNADYNIISNNVCSGQTDGNAHIAIANDSNKNIVANNICTGSGGYGILIASDVSGTPDRNLVIGNICKDNSTNYGNTGTNTEAGHNITA